MEQSIRCGIDIAKLVFQIHGVNAKSGETVMVKKLARHDMLHFFVNKPHMLIGIEACGGAHYWARELTKLGHTVKLITPQYVAPYRRGGKMRILIYLNTYSGDCEHQSFPALGSAPF